jgi:hypothetical protein
MIQRVKDSRYASRAVLGCSAHLEEPMPVNGGAATHGWVRQTVDNVDTKSIVLARY